MIIPYLVRAWILIVLVIPSILCCIFVLYHYLAHHQRRNALNNHVIIAIISFSLMYEVTAIVWHTYFYYTSVPLSSTLDFCHAWIIFDYVGASTIFLLMAWATIERHILIFHVHWFATWKKCLLLHYLPLFICPILPLALLSTVFLSQSCAAFLDFTNFECGLGNCLYIQRFIGISDALIDVAIPLLIIIFVGLALVVRVVYQRYRAGQRVRWKKYRKLATQILSISTIHLLFTFPYAVMNLAYTVALSVKVGTDYFSVFLYLAYCGIILLPFACLIQMSHLKEKYKRFTAACLRLRLNIARDVIRMNVFRFRRTTPVLPIVETNINRN